MRSFSKSKKHGKLYRAAAFIMTFLLMFTTVAPNASMFGGAGSTADAATSDGNTYKVLGIMAEYNGTMSWQRTQWENKITARIKSQIPDAKLDMELMHTRNFNCLNEELTDNYDYIVVIVNEPFSHVGEAHYYSETQMRKDDKEQPADVDEDGKVEKVRAYNTDSPNTYPWKEYDLYKSVNSGNDITGVKLKELKHFYDCDYPVEFLTLDHLKTQQDVESWLGSAEYGNEKECNVAKLYDQVNGVDAQIDGNHTEEADNRVKNIRKNRVDLDIIKSPLDYTEGYANTGEETSKLLEYTFKITDGIADASSRKYTAKFYIDTNNDGIFNEELEGLSHLGITLEKNSKRNIDSNALESGVEYRLTVNASKYVGLVNWKLVISDNADSERRFSHKQGACKLRRMNGQNPEKLRIIQLTASPKPTSKSSQWTYNTVYLPNRAEVQWMRENKITRNNIATEAPKAGKNLFKTDNTSNTYIYNMNSSTAKLQNMWDFYKYMYSDAKDEGLSDYDIYIDRVYVNDIDKVADAECNDEDHEKDTEDYYITNEYYDKVKILYQYLTNNYDMIIVGFADCYDDVDNVICDAVQAFISEGKSVLFTHDTSSFVNVKASGKANNNWGYNINRKMRNILGMDRFGITLKDKYGNTLTEEERRAQGKDYYNREAGATQDYDHGYAEPNIRFGVNFSKNIKNDINEYRKTHGMENDLITEDVYIDDNTYYNGGKTGTNYKSYKASRINKGPITEYPYEINEEISISETHPQYYQLDLESDDIVVWYALMTPSNRRYNDGRNYYYIYNKGNITYSGVGNIAGLSDSEVKLFTNTMIASYRAGDSALTIEVTDWDASTTETVAANKTYDYVTLPIDYIKKKLGAFGESIINNISGTKTTQYRRVKFKIYDNTVAARKEVSIDFYEADSKSDMQYTKLNYFAGSIYRLSDGKVVMKNGKIQPNQKLESGEEYYIYVPLKDFDIKQIFRGEVMATVYPSGLNSLGITIRNSVYVNFNNRLQFNLS